MPFSFAANAPHFRIQTTCLLILSSVNFRWIVTQRLPTVSYLTTLDVYAIIALILLVSLSCWHAIIGSKMIDDTARNAVDMYMLIGIGAFYFLFHVVYIIFFMWKFHRYAHVGKDSDKEAPAVLYHDSNSDLYSVKVKQSMPGIGMLAEDVYQSNMSLKNKNAPNSVGPAASVPDTPTKLVPPAISRQQSIETYPKKFLQASNTSINEKRGTGASGQLMSTREMTMSKRKQNSSDVNT